MRRASISALVSETPLRKLCHLAQDGADLGLRDGWQCFGADIALRPDAESQR